MLRSDRGLIVALVGCLAFAWLALNDAHYREDQASAANSHSQRTEQVETARSGIPFPAERFTSNPEPKSTDEREKRDLAAQEASAAWGFWVAFLAAIQVIATIFGLYYIKRTLDATFQAVEDTGKATKAMQEANSIARQAASVARSAEFAAKIKSRTEDQARTASEQRQMRAYVSVEPGGVNQSHDGISRLPYNIKNSGRTPAYDLSLRGDIIIVQGDPRNFNPAEQGRIGEGDAVASTDITLGPNDNQWSYAYMDDGLIQGHRQKIAQRKAAVVHYGFLEYRDAFDNIRRTNFAFYHWGDELSDKESKRCRFGNSAT